MFEVPLDTPEPSPTSAPTPSPTPVPALPAPDFHRFNHGVALLGGWFPLTVEIVAVMLADNPSIAQTVITHRFPLQDAAEAFRVAGDRTSGAIKVVLHP
jgi:threonine dehydrogenase-like Zn-dependent dehydrogenase